jgi:hypothetical protein
MHHPPTLLPGWGPLTEPPRRLHPAGAVLRWWWPTTTVAGFLGLVAVVGDRDHPAPGLSMRGLVILILAAAALTILTIRRRFGPWALTRALAEYAVLVLLVALLATPTPEQTPATSTRSPAAKQQAAKQGTASLPPGISQIVGAGRRLANAGHWLLDLWRRADHQTTPQSAPTNPEPNHQARPAPAPDRPGGPSS